MSVGSELLLGQIIDTNAAFIARHLAALGLDLFHKTTVGDNLGRVAAALETALGRVEVVIYPTQIGVATTEGAREAEHRPGGDLRQVRLRAVVLALDGLRRALSGPV